MENISQNVYNRINNDVYKTQGDAWWQEDHILHILKTSINPWRVGYAKRVLKELNFDPRGKAALEVGSGGGILTEEIAEMGFITTGIEPALESVQAARKHAEELGLSITYEQGTGESLPYADQSFDSVFCCDVLEHVRDLPKVISEISRVLKPNGVFIYDTINRTFVSNLVAIKIWQEWKWWAFMPPNVHVWKMFIKPEEMKVLLAANELEWQDHTGSEPNVPLPTMLKFLRRRATGKWSNMDLGKNFWLKESNDMNILYGGYAIKK